MLGLHNYDIMEVSSAVKAMLPTHWYFILFLGEEVIMNEWTSTNRCRFSHLMVNAIKCWFTLRIILLQLTVNNAQIPFLLKFLLTILVLVCGVFTFCDEIAYSKS